MEEYLNGGDPSILRFLIASGDKVSSKQLRDDLMAAAVPALIALEAGQARAEKRKREAQVP